MVYLSTGKKLKLKIIFFLIIILFVYSCKIYKLSYILKKLDIKSKNIKIIGNKLQFEFSHGELTEIKVVTKKNINNFNFSFAPVREKNLECSLSFFFNYIDNKNFYRVNFFLDTANIHIYKKQNGEIKNLLYTSIKDYNYINKENNVFTVRLKDGDFNLIINNKIYFIQKIKSKGKVGFGAYGRKGEKVYFVFRNNKK